MKEEVFNKYVDKVIRLFDVTKEELFSKNKSRDVVDARQLLIYLCYQRQMKIVTIQKFMEKNGYKIFGDTVRHSIKVINQKIDEDRDYQTIISGIENSVFI